MTGKKSNVVPIHKRDSKNLIKNYRLISLLPIFSKVLKDLYLIPCSVILYKTSSALTASLASLQAIHELLNSCQLRMKSNNSSYSVRGTFLDIWKAFDKVWHKGLIFKLKSYGIDGGLLTT